MARRLEKDQDYIEAGVRPPERIVHHGSEEVKLDVHVHKWEQRGNFLHCSAGQHGHGMPFDHLNKILVGTSPEGAPMLEDLTITQVAVDNKA